jgi:hypothetical protein
MTTPINNLYGRDGFFWWMGVVEDREDPLFLGRCRVRIFGYHIDNKDLMPTRDLPWAIPIQGVTSAAMSGVGTTPLGPMPGTWVMGFFADGKDCQQPMILGTFAGFKLPTDACLANQAQDALFAPNVRRDGNGNPMTDGLGRPIIITQSSSNAITAAPLNNTGPIITVVGDSLAAGTGAALANKKAGVTVVATVGISTKRILQDITRQTNAHNPRFAVLSGGGNDLADVVANTPAELSAAKNRIDAVKANAKQVRTVVNAGAAVVWLLSRNRIAAEAIRQVAAEYGDRVIDTINYASADGIHPKDYNAVARDVLKLLEGVGRGVDTPQDAASNNLASNIIPSPYVLRDLPPLTKSDVQVLMNGIAYNESSSVPGGAQNYGIIQEKTKFLGKYQIGSDVLTTLDYIKWTKDPKTGEPAAYTNETIINVPSVWAGKNNLRSAGDFLANGPLQEQIMFANLEFNYKILLQRNVISPTTDRRQVAGLLHAAHLSGAGGATIWARYGRNKADYLGTSREAAYAISYNNMAAGGRFLYNKQDYNRGLSYTKPSGVTVNQTAPNNGLQPPPNADPAGPLNDPRIGNELGFNDPNSVYPTCEYAFHPDTNKLATGQDLASTIVKTKVDNAITEIPVANVGMFETGLGSAELANLLMPNKWNEQVYYNARHPYNKVTETESGHTIEFDDTPGAERIHVYHRSGTYSEIGYEGSQQRRIEGNDLKIVIRDSKVYVQGNYDVTVSGAHNLLVESALNVQVRGQAVVNVESSCEFNVAGDFKVNAGGDFKVRAKNLLFEAVQVGADMSVVPTGDEVVSDVTGSPPLVKPGNITFYATGDYRLTGLGNYDLFTAGNIVNFAVGRFNAQAITDISLYSPGVLVADAAAIYWNTGYAADIAAATVPAVAPLTGLKPTIPSLAEVINDVLTAGVDFIATKADAGGAHASDALSGDSDLVEDAARQGRGGKSGLDYDADESIRKGGFTDSDKTQPLKNAGRSVDASDLNNMKNIPETAKVSKKWSIGNFLSKGQLAFLTTTVAVGLSPAGDRNLSVGEKLGLGAVLAGSKSILSTAGLSNTQKIIGTLGVNLAVTRLRGEKGYPLGLGFTVLAKSLPAFVDIGLDSYSKANPDLTSDQRRNLGWIGVGAAAVSAAASNPNVNSKNFAQQVGLNVLGAGYTYSVNTGILSTGTQRYLGQVGVTLASNSLRGDNDANKRLLRNLGGAALGAVVDQGIQRILNGAYGLLPGQQSSGTAVIGRVLGQIVRNEITGQRAANRRIIGYAAGSYISDLVYNDIVDSYGGTSAALAAQASSIIGGGVSNSIVNGSLTGQSSTRQAGRNVGYQGGQNYSTGPNGGRLTNTQIATNIKALAVNTMDPIADRYPDVKVLVGYLDGVQGQHSTGQAVDIHFPKRPNSEYYEIARWIRDNVAFDQLLLETEVLQGVQRFWIHISFNLDGNRPPTGVFEKGTQGPKVGTVVGGKLYRPFLVQLARGST